MPFLFTLQAEKLNQIMTITTDGSTEWLQMTLLPISVSPSGITPSAGGAYGGWCAEEETAGALQ